ncbi:phenylacetate--CoA ligase [Lentisphaerota bacterium WC36G]|nr:phenylacetate--CoA ligase [Lentisphaerae bacterium WC36]
MTKQFYDNFNDISANDYLPREQLADLQLQRLKAVVKKVYENVELFRQRLDEKNISVDDIKSLKDLAKLPFTVKTDLRDTYPYGLFAEPLSNVVRLHASSGTTGKPIVVGYTANDIDTWASVMQRSFACCGLHLNDVIQNAYGYGLFTGGLGAHYGAEAIGATVVPISGGNTARQIMVMKDFGVTAICCTPSYFCFIAEQCEEMGIDMKDLPIRAGIFGAEPWTEEMRIQIENMTGVKAFDIYGLSEIIGPGVGIECKEQNGLHIFEDHFYPEIINPETGEVLPDGQEGELVITTLTKEAFPMIRYRTRDITSIMTEKCSCGRTIRKIHRIGRRSDDMMIIRGVNVFPSQIEAAILAVEGTVPHYQITLYSDNGRDNIQVEIEVTPEVFSDKVRMMENLQHQLTSSIEETIGLRVKVILVAPHTITRSEGKAKRVIDNRQN